MCKNKIHDCLLCYEGSCSKLYKNIDAERILQAIKFDNVLGARYLIKDENNCFEKNSIDFNCPSNLDIDYVLKDLINNVEKVDNVDDIDLSTEICGIKLENPFILSSSVVGSRYEMIKKAFEIGWAGVSVKTISLMSIKESSPRLSCLKENDESFLGFKNIEQLSEHTLEENMDMIRKLKKEFPNKVVIASIMGKDEAEWATLAKEVTNAGADLIELNFSCPNMKHKGTGSDVGQNPELVELYTKVVKENTSLPILAKMTPNITDIKAPALAAKRGGTDGISAINTIKSITGIDIDNFVPAPDVNGKSSLGGYSGRAVKPIALRFIAEMTTSKELEDLYFSGIGGIYTWKDALEFMFLGCTSIQVTTSVLEYGYRIVEDLILGLKIYMKTHNFKKVSDFVSLSKSNLILNDLLDKDTIEFPRFNYDKCVGCGRCYLSCRDGGHNAIKFDNNRRPILDPSKCVGCHLCKLVCPKHAIDKSPKRIRKEILNKNTNIR